MSTDRLYEPLTAERERNLRREHFEAHPGGLTPISRKPCTICLLLRQLSWERSRSIYYGDADKEQA